MKRLSLIAAALLLAAACGRRDVPRRGEPTVAATAAAAHAAADRHNAANALDCEGTYTGMFPAADAPGIAVTLTLGPDGRYTELQRFCERPGEFACGGRYTVAGNVLTLQPDSSEDDPSYYRVGENRLWRLDSQQQPITGPFADQYVLTRSKSGAEAACD